MTRATIPDKETARVASLRALHILDTPAEPRFDRIVQLAARILQTPIALVSLVDESRQWFKARVGLDATETPREDAFCSHAILRSEVMVVADTHEDERFKDNPLVTGPPYIRFYAGAPLRVDAHTLGTLCVIDKAPRRLTDDERASLALLAEMATEELHIRRLAVDASRQLQLLELVEEVAGVGHWRIECPGNTVTWSDQMFRIFERDPASFETTVETFVNVFEAHEAEGLMRDIDEALDGGKGFRRDLQHRRPDGTIGRVDLRACCQVRPSDDHEIMAVFGVVRDISSLADHRGE